MHHVLNTSSQGAWGYIWSGAQKLFKLSYLVFITLFEIHCNLYPNYIFVDHSLHKTNVAPEIFERTKREVDKLLMLAPLPPPRPPESKF